MGEEKYRQRIGGGSWVRTVREVKDKSQPKRYWNRSHGVDSGPEEGERGRFYFVAITASTPGKGQQHSSSLWVVGSGSEGAMWWQTGAIMTTFPPTNRPLSTASQNPERTASL
ncbi:hypothetical protein ZHAS_00005734 [Anopheles sinensis]|uniref:Uncharacterized protein n=1 Tax=Anopheles sinensis TaxID=74873 RepID=A0A084VK86_ANOSI|nr:hypothetical protein ZHAS_00005734 [Anopheles sinensis]